MKNTFTLDAGQVVSVIRTLSNIPYRKGIECSEFVQLTFAPGAVHFRLATELIGYGEVKAAEVTDKLNKLVLHLDRGPLFPFLLGFESAGGQITVDVEPEKVKLRGGNRSATFTPNDLKTAYPDHILRDEKAIKFTEKQESALKVLKYYVCEDALSPELTGIYLSHKNGCMLASNRLAIAGYWGKDPLPFSGPYPAALVPLHDGAKLYRSSKDSLGVRLSTGKASLTQILRAETTNFPAAKAAASFPTVKPKLTLEAGALAAVVSRLKACSGDALDQLGVTLTAKGGRVEITTKTVSAVLRESIKTKTPTECVAEMLWSTLHPLVTSLPGDALVNIGWDAGPYLVWAKDSVKILATKKTA